MCRMPAVFSGMSGRRDHTEQAYFQKTEEMRRRALKILRDEGISEGNLKTDAGYLTGNPAGAIPSSTR